MTSSPTLKFDALMAPIPGDDPAGGSVPYEVHEALDQDRREINPDDFDADDPRRPTEPKRAEWLEIVQIAEKTLVETSKDLMVAARLLEALVNLHGFAGLRDGLHLMRLLVEQCWDRLRPPADEEDYLEIRAAAFHWLDDPDRGAHFPHTVRKVPLVAGEAGPIGWHDWQSIQTGHGSLKAEDFEKAVAATPREHCQEAVDDLKEAASELEQLVALLNAKMGPEVPGLTALRQAVSECRTLAQQILQRKMPVPIAAATDEEGHEADVVQADGRGTLLIRSLSSRAEIYQHLAEAAYLLQQLEPHSPVPYLIRRAIKLGGLDYPELTKALISDAAVLADMSRVLGIPELQPQSS